MVQQYQSPVRVYKHPFALVMMVCLLCITQPSNLAVIKYLLNIPCFYILHGTYVHIPDNPITDPIVETGEYLYKIMYKKAW